MTQQSYEILKSLSMNPSSMSALGGGGGFIHPLPGRDCLKVGGRWVMEGWKSLKLLSHALQSFHTNALIDWCGSTGNAACV